MNLFLRQSLSNKNYFRSCKRTIKILRTNSNEAKEFQIPASWGTIAGKEWGPKDGRPVLAIHGWLDNANTFDTLIPHLHEDLHIYAVDIPGHGKSSHLGPGARYGYDTLVLMTHIIVKKLLLENFIFIGHSMGAEAGYLYASLVPEAVSQLIGIDLIKPVTYSFDTAYGRAQNFLEGNSRFEMQKAVAPSYTEEEALKRQIAGSQGSLTSESAAVLLKRALVPSTSGSGYMFNYDRRFKFDAFDYGVSNNILFQYATKIKSDVLYIKAIPGINYESDEEHEKMKAFFTENISNFNYVEVNGGHHVHLTEPEKVGPIINKFIEDKKL